MVVFRDIKFGGLSRGKRNSATTKANVSEDPLLVTPFSRSAIRATGQTGLFGEAEGMLSLNCKIEEPTLGGFPKKVGFGIDTI